MHKKPRGPTPALLRKGGVHQTCRSAERFSARQAVDEALDDWYATREATAQEMSANDDQQGAKEPPALFYTWLIFLRFLADVDVSFNPSKRQGI